MFLIHVGIFAMALAACMLQYIVSSSRRGQVDAVAMAVLLMVGLALGVTDVLSDLPLSVTVIAGFAYVALAVVVLRRQIVDTRRLEREVAELEMDRRRARTS